MTEPVKKKSSARGCLIAVGIVAALCALACLIGGIALNQVANSPEGKKVFGAIGSGVKMATKGMTAPGAAELRELGCPQAIVIDGNEITELVELFVDAGTPTAAPTMVMCQGNALQTVPGCDAIARTYVQAAHPKESFVVIAKLQNNRKSECEGTYSAQGELEEAKLPGPGTRRH